LDDKPINRLFWFVAPVEKIQEKMAKVKKGKTKERKGKKRNLELSYALWSGCKAKRYPKRYKKKKKKGNSL
jgi:hypothetical protein